MISIEWLLDRIEDVDNTPKIWEQIKIQAKEIHKQEIIDAYLIGQSLGFDDNPRYMAEQYYQEKYGNNQLQLSNRGNILVDQKIESYVELKPKKD
jgi:hypothetical protein